MKHTRITIELSLYFLAFLLALGIRFLNLGAAPLSDSEAGWALQALRIAQGEGVTLGPQPGFVLLTSLGFFIFGSSNALARFWPALAGSLIVWLPYLFRSYLDRYAWGRKAGLIVAFGLALDPGLAVASRLAGSPMLAMTFLLFALAWAIARRPVLAGLFVGLAALSGPAALHGGLGLVVAWVAWKLLARFGSVSTVEATRTASIQSQSLRTGILTASGTILLAGTLFLWVPEGLGALAGAVPAYLSGWVVASGIPASRLLAALAFYQPLAVIFGLIAGLRSWFGEWQLPRWLSLWVLSALVLALLYPGRQVIDVAWVIFPLWALAGIELARHTEVYDWELLPALGQAILIVLLLSLAWLNLAGLAQAGTDVQVTRLRWAVIGGTLVLGTVTGILVALGWSRTVAQRGLSWGLSAGLGLFILANTWGATQLRPNSPEELWAPAPTTQQAGQLLQTLGDLSEWQTGHRKTLDLLVLADWPSLRWALRDWRDVNFSSDLAANQLPALIIKPGDQPAPILAEAYRGQDFLWRAYPGWETSLPADWPSWLVTREVPERQEYVILWARSDLFPDGTAESVEEFTPPEEELSPDEGEILPSSRLK